jgi:hypothetical protein
MALPPLSIVVPTAVPPRRSWVPPLLTVVLLAVPPVSRTCVPLTTVALRALPNTYWSLPLPRINVSMAIPSALTF